MDLRHLRYFLCVAEEMHFGRAALRLGISQPPLSQQIRALEEELGVRLFDRTSRRVRLTEAGRLFEPEARRTLAQADRAAQIARMAQRAEIGRLGLGFTTSGPFVPPVARALYRFRQTYPDVELILREQGRDEQVESVASRQLDLGIVRNFEAPALPEGMLSRCLLKEEMVLALRADHPLALRPAPPRIADLSDEPLVLYGAPNGTGFTEHFQALCAEAGFVPKISHEARSLATLLGLVAAGFGPTVIAGSMARLHVDNVINRPFDVPVMSALWLIHHEDLSPTGQAFLKTLLEERHL
ncbi:MULTISPECIES: LysR substrate-binding domain-containing protein [unclassified Sphingobium]|jgi:DNA-binding transcriptional LysR family regulator|uniref:LysR substrate-binding domain-containing protein n=1 Tax=Sphingobium TaxID=165695 RepID=UPI0005CBB5E0|nr:MULTISPECIES: LysR substrate-binding domain-containing protein [unclassified Sphingobium]AJR23459.1 LysR family transcriptional regulator [Sphingobium sp. YBL2]UXC93487.1 LysR substrate-binding domain-containing protein [Sphingobium sp. RSMS]